MALATGSCPRGRLQVGTRLEGQARGQGGFRRSPLLAAATAYHSPRTTATASAAPPPPQGITFPIMWVLIVAPLRAYSSMTVFEAR